MIPYKELLLTEEYWKEVIENRLIVLGIKTQNSKLLINLLTIDILKALNDIKE